MLDFRYSRWVELLTYKSRSAAAARNPHPPCQIVRLSPCRIRRVKEDSTAIQPINISRGEQLKKFLLYMFQHQGRDNVLHAIGAPAADKWIFSFTVMHAVNVYANTAVLSKAEQVATAQLVKTWIYSLVTSWGSDLLRCAPLLDVTSVFNTGAA
jgi:hypothetical protein